MAMQSTRRGFLKQAAIAGAAAPLILTGKARAETGRLRHASVGVGGQRGGHDLGEITSHPAVEVVALCDVDETFLNAAAQLHPNARLYRDWRIMLAEEAAKRPNVVTQMGVQTHSAAEYRNAVAIIQAGAVGPIREVHSWDRVRFHYTGAFQDPPMERQPETGIEPPAHLDWDLWLGVAPVRPYNDELYHIRMWRRWHDFGGGARGDMAGHMMDVVFDALKLTAPEWLMSHRSPPFADTYSPDNHCVHRFPGTAYTTESLDYHWHDTTTIDTTGWPVQEADLPGNGSMFIGEKGFVFVPHGGEPQVFPVDDFRDASDRILASLERIPGVSHFHQFVDACLGKGATTTPFAYAGNLTETVLLGNIANRFPGERLAWNVADLSFPDKPEANAFLRRDYREGWQIYGLG